MSTQNQGLFRSIRGAIERSRENQIRLRKAAAEFDETRGFQIDALKGTNLELDARPDSEFPEKLEGKVLFANARFAVVAGERYMTLVHHDGNPPPVGMDVQLGWNTDANPVPNAYGHPQKGWVFSWTERVREHAPSPSLESVSLEVQSSRKHVFER